MHDVGRPSGQKLVEFRDLRAKARTDKTDRLVVQLQLGHKSLKMTEHYARKRRSDKVGPKR